jgi:hypothetical protein
VTALLNPVAGVGILASGLLPSVGGKLAKSGASIAGDRLRDWSRKRQHKKLAREAEVEVSRLKPQVFVNPVLKKLEMILSNPSGEEDPLLDEAFEGQSSSSTRYFRVTAEGVSHVYEHLLKEKKGPFSPAVKAWLQHLVEIARDGSQSQR